MPSAEQNTTPQPSLASRIGIVARAGAVAVAILYGIGFVILCSHDAGYGVFEFDLLRARIFLIGFTFAALCLLPGAAKHYGLAYYGPLKPVVGNSDPALRRRRYIVLGDGFVYTAWLIATPISLLLFSTTTPPARPWWRWGVPGLAAFVVLIAAYSYIGKTFARHPSRATALAMLATGLFLALLYVSAHASGSPYQTDLANLTVFFFTIGWLLEEAKSETNRLRWALDYRNWVLVLVLLGFYLVNLFGAIQPRFGGGAPQHVVVYLSRPVAWLNAGPVDVSLIDETGRGLYVLPSPRDKALFVPAASVAAVYFGPQTDLPKQPK